VVDHLRWDLSAIFEMAVAEKVIDAKPATRLYTPKHAPKGQTRAMSVEEVKTALEAVELRERVLLHMAIFSVFRPGEMLALQRRHVAADGSAVRVEQRVYRGVIDSPKTDPSRREVAIPPMTAELLREWMESAVGPEPEAFVFAGEKGTPLGDRRLREREHSWAESFYTVHSVSKNMRVATATEPDNQNNRRYNGPKYRRYHAEGVHFRPRLPRLHAINRR